MNNNNNNNKRKRDTTTSTHPSSRVLNKPEILKNDGYQIAFVKLKTNPNSETSTLEDVRLENHFTPQDLCKMRAKVFSQPLWSILKHKESTTDDEDDDEEKSSTTTKKKKKSSKFRNINQKEKDESDEDVLKESNTKGKDVKQMELKNPELRKVFHPIHTSRLNPAIGTIIARYVIKNAKRDKIWLKSNRRKKILQQDNNNNTVATTREEEEDEEEEKRTKFRLIDRTLIDKFTELYQKDIAKQSNFMKIDSNVQRMLVSGSLINIQKMIDDENEEKARQHENHLRFLQQQHKDDDDSNDSSDNDDDHSNNVDDNGSMLL